MDLIITVPTQVSSVRSPKIHATIFDAFKDVFVCCNPNKMIGLSVCMKMSVVVYWIFHLHNHNCSRENALEYGRRLSSPSEGLSPPGIMSKRAKVIILPPL